MNVLLLGYGRVGSVVAHLFAQEKLFNLLIGDTWIAKDNSTVFFAIKENFTGEEEYLFPAPFGKRKTCLISQEEVGTLPIFIKTKNAVKLFILSFNKINRKGVFLPECLERDVRNEIIKGMRLLGVKIDTKIDEDN